MNTDNLYIPDKQYIRFKNKYNGDRISRAVPYFPDAESDRQESKIETLDLWSDDSIGPMIHKNTPQDGFHFEGEKASGYRRRSSQKWAINGARNMTFLITGENLSFLLKNVDIVGREFQSEMIWAYEKGNSDQLWLLPADPNVKAYRKAAENGDLHRNIAQDNRISLRDLNRGDKVILKTGERVQYLGGLHYLKNSGRKRRDYFYLSLEKDEPYSISKKSGIDPYKIIEEADEEDQMTQEEAAEYVNNLFSEIRGEEDFSKSYHYPRTPGHAILCHKKKFDFEDAEIDQLSSDKYHVEIGDEEYDIENMSGSYSLPTTTS
jgi:hypothetical protein